MISRQRKWQLKKMAQGLCCTCGEKAVGDSYCREHLDYHRKSNRDAYRVKHGIPEDQPLMKTGRPRLIK